MSKPQTMQMQLVGDGNVIVLTIPGEVPVSVAISDEEFISGIDQLIQQARPHTKSLLRRLRVDSGP